MGSGNDIDKPCYGEDNVMHVLVTCEAYDCYCNEDGYCKADLGICIDGSGECTTYRDRDDVEGRE